MHSPLQGNAMDEAAKRGKDLATEIWDMGTAMNRAAAAQVSVCPACAGTRHQLDLRCQGNIVLRDERDKARAKVATLTATLEELLEYFEDRYDVVDDEYSQPTANREMQLGQMIEMALGMRP